MCACRSRGCLCLSLCLDLKPTFCQLPSLFCSTLLLPFSPSLRTQPATLTWPLLTLALCVSKWLLPGEGAAESLKMWEPRWCDNAAGTLELGYRGCLSFPHWTWHGCGASRPQSKNKVEIFHLVRLNLKAVVRLDKLRVRKCTQPGWMRCNSQNYFQQSSNTKVAGENKLFNCQGKKKWQLFSKTLKMSLSFVNSEMTSYMSLFVLCHLYTGTRAMIHCSSLLFCDI